MLQDARALYGTLQDLTAIADRAVRKLDGISRAADQEVAHSDLKKAVAASEVMLRIMSQYATEKPVDPLQQVHDDQLRDMATGEG